MMPARVLSRLRLATGFASSPCSDSDGAIQAP
jgi:hypothetical protein